MGAAKKPYQGENMVEKFNVSVPNDIVEKLIRNAYWPPMGEIPEPMRSSITLLSSDLRGLKWRLTRAKNLKNDN